MKITLGWWNTSLSPATKNDLADDFSRMQAIQVIIDLLSDTKIDFLGLCEVSTNDIAYLSANIPEGYRCLAFSKAYGRGRFDLGLIFKSSLAQSEPVHTYRMYVDGSWNYALGVEVQVVVGDEPLVLLLSHWPSRMHKARNAPERAIFGTELRRILGQYGDSKIVMMGDYNDEPFDDPLCSFLKASRDRGRVSSKKNIFYNPFWRKLGAHSAYDGKGPKNWAAGTYYHASGRETKWYTFDQMMFSEPFLRSSGFHLNEDGVRILSSDDLLHLVRSKANRFDHLPVIAVIER